MDNSPKLRERSRSQAGHLADCRIMNVYNGGTPTLAWTSTSRLGNIDDVCVDFVTPNFRSRSSAGEIIDNYFNHRVVTYFGGGGSYYAQHKTAPSVYYNEGEGSLTEFFAQWVPELDFLPHAVNDSREAINDLYNSVILKGANKIDSTNTSVLEDALELQKTIMLMSHPISTIYDLSRKYRRAVLQLYNFKRQARKSKGTGESTMANALAQTWLTARFGFAQPVLTLMTLHQAYLQQDRDSPTMRRVGAGDFFDFSRDRIISKPGSYSFRIEDSTHQSYNAWFKYIAKHPFSDTISGQLGLRLKDVPKGLWQVMPQSWVVDRFVDIGSFIGAGMKLNDPTIKILSSGVTYKGTSLYSRQCLGDANPDWNVTISGDRFGWETSLLTRIPGTPTFTDFLPRLKNPLKGKSLQSNLDLLSFAVLNLTSPGSRIW